MLSKVLPLLFLCCLCFYSALTKTESVSVAVYYESVCPDSRNFFIKQLYPTLQKNISSYINLTLVPYGLSKRNEIDGESQFNCHHGPYECFGNKIHSCAINNIPPTSAENKGFNPTTVAFINCLMSDYVKKDVPGEGPTYEFPVANCSLINGVPNYVTLIENCAGHSDGGRYLAKMGLLTDALNPKLTNVPTVVFNGKFAKSESDDAQKDFVKVLCSHIEGPEKPSDCKDAASATTLSFLVVLLALVKQLF